MTPNHIQTQSVKDMIIKNEDQDLYFNQTCIKIIDNGQGISEEGLEKLFINFEALHEHQKSNQRGTGLGLSICKQIIEKMGGTIQVTSKLGEGTQFKIDLIFLCIVRD